jgi:hypothetical protein
MPDGAPGRSPSTRPGLIQDGSATSDRSAGHTPSGASPAAACDAPSTSVRAVSGKSRPLFNAFPQAVSRPNELTIECFTLEHRPGTDADERARRMIVTLGRAQPFKTARAIRYHSKTRGDHVFGVELTSLSPEQREAVGAYIQSCVRRRSRAGMTVVRVDLLVPRALNPCRLLSQIGAPRPQQVRAASNPARWALLHSALPLYWSKPGTEFRFLLLVDRS